MSIPTSPDESTPLFTVPVPLVAIGASAGGLEAVSQLFKHLSPTTGLAYVYIQHLNPSYDSQLAAILSRATTMPVIEAEHLMPIAANHVYIIPPNKDMEIMDGVLTLMPRRTRSAMHLPIDQFFTSLAERQKAGAIGVVLSGMAHDGTLGLRAIKAAGGITFAQNETARYQSMPRTAIAGGVVDMVLPPAEIAREIERLSQQPELFVQMVTRDVPDADAPDASDTPEEDLRLIIQFLRKSVGVDFSNYKMTTIRRRIIRRMVLFKLDSLRDYARYLRSTPGEADLLYSDLLINVTSFFRDAETMNYLKKEFLPKLVQEKGPTEPFRVWIAGCSTGQEAYSMAMMLLEVMDELNLTLTIQIFATDLSESAINRARQGTYARSELTDVSAKRMQHFFTKIDDRYRISKTIRDLCVFAPHNLLKDPPFSRIDLISCRNLLIYLNTVLQRKAIGTFHYALNPSGYLLLGKSETVATSATLFLLVEKNYKIYARRNDTVSRTAFELNPRIPTPNRMEEPTNRNQPPKGNLPTGDLDKLVDTLLLSRYVPTSVVVDQDLEILQFRGSTSLFLEPSPGKASLNLLKMARPALTFELRNLVHKARKTGLPVRKTGLEVVVNEQTHQVTLEAIPLNNGSEGQLYLIVFTEVFPLAGADPATDGSEPGRIKQLEAELAAVRQDMRSIIEEQEASNEELQSANEEIVSSNEELQSINEELETSKEEIESTNEELQTINQELQVRNDQLTEAHMYAEAIFGTIREATLVLDRDLRVKSANRAFYQIFRVQENDTQGHLLYELGDGQWDITRLRQQLEDVIMRNVHIRGFEVVYTFPDVGEKIMLIHARRVIQQQRQEAILLAIEDVTEQRRAQRLLEERQAWFHDIVDNAPALIWVAGPDGHYNFFNRAWLDYTGRQQEGKSGADWLENIHPNDRNEYLITYRANFKLRQAYQIEFRLKRCDGNYRWMMESARPTFTPDGAFSGYIGTCAEIHIQKTLNQELDRRVTERTQELTAANLNMEKSNRELTQMAENLQAVLDGSPASVGLLKAVHNPDQNEVVDFRLTVFNQKFAHLVRKPISQLNGLTVDELADTLWGGETMDQFRTVYSTGEAAYREQHVTIKGKEQWWGMSISKHDDGVVMSGLDITPLKQAEQQQESWLKELERSQESLQTADQMRQHIRERGEFLRVTSHDLRGSFGVIQGAASLLNLMDTQEERAQMLTMLNRNLRQVTQLLTQLLDYSRLESGQEQVQVQTFDVCEMMHELCESVQPLAAERGLTVSENGPDKLPVENDSVKVRRIAQNLLLNALGYTQTGGVVINWGYDAGADPATAQSWQFSIQDTGPGLPERTINRLLGLPEADEEPEQANAGASGEGIGLAIVNQLCKLLKATIEVDSQSDQGTLIRVRFPMRVG